MWCFSGIFGQFNEAAWNLTKIQTKLNVVQLSYKQVEMELSKRWVFMGSFLSTQPNHFLVLAFSIAAPVSSFALE